GMDHTGGMLAAFAAVAALCAKRRGDLGQHVDVSLRDMGSSFIGPALLDYAMNGREAMRQGNRDDSGALQGVYRCRGKDAWVSISVASEEEWQGMVRAMGDPDWAQGDEFGDAFRRWKSHDRLDGLIEAWTAQRTPAEATNLLQAHGVAAAPSLTADQLMADPHLQEREAFPKVLHPEKGEQKAVAPPWRLSGTPAVIDQWTPDLGENDLDVFHGILGLGEAEVERLQEAKVIW
ncbi:MAG: CoA transferase, partial [Chloroflexi bacterium]|nr:CoA transferase [Chloroflexota bacterium]